MASSSRIRRKLTAVLSTMALAVAATATVTVASASSAAALDNGLALTPPMGFNDWNAFGCNVSEQLIEQTADSIVASGLKAAGYDYVNIDDCWMTHSRDAGGHLVPDPAKFPDGISGTAAYVHSLGLKLGIYEDAGSATCAGYPGSYGHETTDAQDFADWGVDYLKYDNCNIVAGTGDTQAEYIDRYTRMRDALEATGHPFIYSLCEWGRQNVWTWGSNIGNLWRTTGDIGPTFSSMLSIFQSNVGLAQYAGPGHWNDPDMLEVGNGMSPTEDRTEFSLWSEMAAPLIAGTDLRVGAPISRVPGELDGALHLNGSGQYVSLPTGIVSGLNDFTISAWVNPTANTTWSRIFDFGSGTTANMFLTVNAGAGPRFAITTTGSGGEQRLNDPAPLPTNAWTHVAVTLSGTTGSLYVNGALVATNPNMTLHPSNLGSTSRNYIGKSQYSDPTYNGAVDDFQIYDHALTAADVQALAGGQPGAGNVASYRFDEASGTVAADSSGNGHDATIFDGGVTPTTLSILTNKDVVAVDQDALGKQANVIAHNGSLWTLDRPLANGDHATVLFNADATATPMSVSMADLGLDAAKPYIVRDLWTHTATAVAGALSADVDSHAVKMVRVSADTFANLRDLVAEYSTDPAVTAGLNDKLTAAENAPNATVRDNTLAAFDSQVQAQTGKALSSDQAQALVTLADALR